MAGESDNAAGLGKLAGRWRAFPGLLTGNRRDREYAAAESSFRVRAATSPWTR